MQKWLVSTAAKGNEQWARDCHRVEAEDAQSARAHVQARIDANRGFSFMVGGWSVTDVEPV